MRKNIAEGIKQMGVDHKGKLQQMTFERVVNFQERKTVKNEQRDRYLKEKVQTIESLETEEQKMVEELKHTKQLQSKLLNKLKMKIEGRRFTGQ